jgi:hypothetical protein
MNHHDFRSTPDLSWIDSLFACPGRLELFGPDDCPIPGSQRLLKPIDPTGYEADHAISCGARYEAFYPKNRCGRRTPISHYRVTGGDMEDGLQAFLQEFVKTDRDTLMVYIPQP